MNFIPIFPAFSHTPKIPGGAAKAKYEHAARRNFKGGLGGRKSTANNL